MPRRIVFDIRSLAESRVPGDGIIRTLRALAHYAAEHRPDTVFAIYDVEQDGFRPVEPRWLAPILNGAKVDTSHFIDPLGHRRTLRARLPIGLRRIVHALVRPRRRAFVWLEGLRVRAKRPLPLLDRIQDALVSDKLAAELRGSDGRRTLLPFGAATGGLLRLTPDDGVVMAGFDWSALFKVSAYVSRPGAPRLVVLCHDIIPLMFPQFYHERDVARFRACFHAVFPAARLVVFTSQRVKNDVVRYCADHDLRLGPTTVVPLGADLYAARDDARAELPLGLRPRRYLLFVSTIEPRKNHRLLLRVWARLVAEGVPQSHGFKLVFAGRRGWKSDDIVAEMETSAGFGESLLHLSDVSDAVLTQLYENAAFCVYPSLYEGFGLPIVESFMHGKAVIASTGGALPETVNGLSPCLDPNDEDAWLSAIRSWIVDPGMPDCLALRIAEQFPMRSWQQAAADFFGEIDRLDQGGGRAVL